MNFGEGSIIVKPTMILLPEVLIRDYDYEHLHLVSELMNSDLAKVNRK